MNQKKEDQILRHYLLEKQLARRILQSPREDRTRVFKETYDQLFSCIPWHPQLNPTAEMRRVILTEKRLMFGHFPGPESNILDIGAGSGDWIRSLASMTSGRCVGIDISEKILRKRPGDPANLEFEIMDAAELTFPAGEFHLVFSSQLLEHLHPDDIERHMSEVSRVLKRNGMYVFDTPSRLSGPHDISRHFDDTATGFHLQEWTYRELLTLLNKTGFTRIRTMIAPWAVVRRFRPARFLGAVPAGWVIPGEMLAAKVQIKSLRLRLCTLLRISKIYLTARKA